MKKLCSYIIAAAGAAVMILGCSARQEGVRPPMMGWNSWNAYMVDISDSIIMNAADMMVAKGLKDAGYDHVNIDDGYFGYRDEQGYMVPHPTRFPDGMKHVPEYIHSLGMKAGIYSDAGDNTCGSSYNKDVNGLGAGMWAHDVQDAELYFNEWGFDFIKIDWCGGRNLGLDEETRYRRIREVIDSVAHKKVEINVCRWSYPGTWVSDVASSWRISADIRPNWPLVCSMIDRNLYLSAYAGGGCYNDMDMMVVGYNGGKDSAFWEDSYARNFGLTYAEEEAHFTMWCAMSSPLLIGCDLTYIPQETLDIITNPELIAVNQDCLGLQSYVIQHDGEGYVLAKDIKKLHSESRAVTLYNPSDSAVAFSVPVSVMEFEGPVSVRDLNARKDLGTFDVLEMVMPAHSARLFEVKGQRAEATIYEAEWAYVPVFSTLEGKVQTSYEPYDGASGRMVAAGVGGNAENELQWRDVYRFKKDKCLATVTCDAAPGTKLHLSVNGKEYTSSVMKDGLSEVSFLIDLKKGSNVVCLGNPDAVIDAVDCLTLSEVPEN